MRSALVFFVPAAEPVVGDLRRTHDPVTAAEIAPHVTLLFPFVPAAKLDEAVLARLAQQFARAPGICGSIDLVFDRVGRFPDLCYLALANADEVQRKILALAAAWPEYPLYEGRFPDPIPHLTIAHGEEPLFARIEAEVAPKLPLVARGEFVSLVVEEAGRWREHTRFALD